MITTDDTAIGAPIAAPNLEVPEEDEEGVGEVPFSDGVMEIEVVVVAEATIVTYDRAVLGSVNVEVLSMTRFDGHISNAQKVSSQSRTTRGRIQYTL